MLKSISFHNFRVLRDATLPLARCTAIIGPNSSGKSTALLGLRVMRDAQSYEASTIQSLGVSSGESVTLQAEWAEPHSDVVSTFSWVVGDRQSRCQHGHEHRRGDVTKAGELESLLRKVRIFDFDSRRIAEPAAVQTDIELKESGEGLAAVLDRIRDIDIDRFDLLNDQIHHWFPEYDRLLMDVQDSRKSVMLRLKRSGDKVPATMLSQGTLFGLALMTLAHLPSPPPLIAIEEPDQGVHPRLMTEIHQSIYRLCYPESFNDPRAPVQVIFTTHSPYLLDLFSDSPNEVVVAQRKEGSGTFSRLSDRDDLTEIIGSTSLGDAWYSGVLGGVPTAT